MLFVRVVEFALLRIIRRVGKRRLGLAVDVVCVPAAVIEVQVRVNHDVDFVGRNARGLEALHQRRLVFVDLARLLVQLGTNAGLDQHGLFSVADEQRV